MDRGAWWAAAHGVAKSRTRLSAFTFTFHFHALEKEMATHSSVLAWRIPVSGEPGGLPSMGWHRVGHDWSDLAAAAAAALHRSLSALHHTKIRILCFIWIYWECPSYSNCTPGITAFQRAKRTHTNLLFVIRYYLTHNGLKNISDSGKCLSSTFLLLFLR